MRKYILKIGLQHILSTRIGSMMVETYTNLALEQLDVQLACEQ